MNPVQGLRFQVRDDTEEVQRQRENGLTVFRSEAGRQLAVRLTHVCTSSFYPQSNGKLERYWHRSLKPEAVWLQTLSDREEAELAT